MRLEELFAAIENDPLERLRWLVCCRFGVLPFSRCARRLSKQDLIICGVHLILDSRLRSATSGDGEAAQNEGFDNKRFAQLVEEDV